MGNANVSFWLISGKTRGVIYSRTTSKILRWSVKYDIAAFPYLLRSLRNISADFATLASAVKIQQWAESRNFTQINLPCRWSEFIACAPKIEWIAERAERPRFSPTSVAGALPYNVAEWNARNGIGIQYRGDPNIWPVFIDIRAVGFNERIRKSGISPWGGGPLILVIGSARVQNRRCGAFQNVRMRVNLHSLS